MVLPEQGCWRSNTEPFCFVYTTCIYPGKATTTGVPLGRVSVGCTYPAVSHSGNTSTSPARSRFGKTTTAAGGYQTPQRVVKVFAGMLPRLCEQMLGAVYSQSPNCNIPTAWGASPPWQREIPSYSFIITMHLMRLPFLASNRTKHCVIDRPGCRNSSTQPA